MEHKYIKPCEGRQKILDNTTIEGCKRYSQTKRTERKREKYSRSRDTSIGIIEKKERNRKSKEEKRTKGRKRAIKRREKD
jgi:hypothetical protein